SVVARKLYVRFLLRNSLSNKYSVLVLFVFFFSSRRRHTRFSRDWSSDVCSSDLAASPAQRCSPRSPTAAPQPGAPDPAHTPASRSEERRVGKECRSLWKRKTSKKNGSHMYMRIRFKQKHGVFKSETIAISIIHGV